MLNAPIENMDVRFAVKQLKLLTNIINEYCHEIPTTIWNNLTHELKEKYEAIKTKIVDANSKNKKRNERIESLDYLVKLLKNKLEPPFSIAT